MSYFRVIPRDLFNESKLLKCVGQLLLKAHDGSLAVTYKHENPESGFRIVQDRDDGGLEIANLQIAVGGVVRRFCSWYNSRSAYPLFVEGDEGELLPVFDDTGEFSAEFLELAETED